LVEGRRSKSNYIRNKKFIVYAVLAIIIIGVGVAYSYSTFTAPTQTKEDVTKLVSESKADAAQKFASQFCGLESSPNSSSLVIEYALPAKCEMPLAIGVDPQTGKIWYVSTKNGTLGSYKLNSATFSEEYKVPTWPSRDNPTMSSQVWDLDFDNMGNIWFTDEKQNALWRFSKHTNSFESFIVPGSSEAFGTTYPVSMELDNSGGKIYFVGIRSPTIWIGSISQMKNGTSDGITPIKIPLGSFKGIDPDLVSTGSIVFDKDRDILYVSLLAFNTKGQILGYDLRNNTFRSYDMPEGITSPVGLTLDSRGKVWVTDHGTSIFYRLDPISGNVTEFTTSPASPRTLGLGTTLEAAYTLPYWIKTDSNGTLWLNEHTGNKIAKFDPINLTLTEYWIPSQNKLWGPCKNSQMQCGISNALQFDVGTNNGVWFTEWSENKIGRVLTNRETPISVSVQPSSIVLARGENDEVKISVTANNNTTVRMQAAGSFTPTGNLGNLSGVFSQDSFDIGPGESREVSFIVTPAQNMEPGNYTLMLGAETDAVSVLKAVPMRIL
jgi:virginiamycin B lyase